MVYLVNRMSELIVDFMVTMLAVRATVDYPMDAGFLGRAGPVTGLAFVVTVWYAFVDVRTVEGKSRVSFVATTLTTLEVIIVLPTAPRARKHSITGACRGIT